MKNPYRDGVTATRARALLVCSSLVFLGGCGDAEQRPEVNPVSGQVLVNGRPAAGALVSFHPAGENFDRRGSRPWAKVREDGRFDVSTYGQNDGAPAGEYAVSIVWLENPDAVVPGADQLAGRFADPETSTFRVTIAQGPNELKPFEMEGVRLQRSPPSAGTTGADPPL